MELPRLSSTELVANFGNDQAALRRYRILAALLREGRPVGEVARTFGVSRESIRRMRSAFAREGMAGLQSRRRGGGHVARESPLIVAIRQELGSEPGMAAPLLWRRVEARLREQGLLAPRSTFYRLLAQLREEADDATHAPVRMLRDALDDLIEIHHWHWAVASWRCCCYPMSATNSAAVAVCAKPCAQPSPACALRKLARCSTTRAGAIT